METKQELSDDTILPSRFMFIVKAGWTSVHADDCSYIIGLPEGEWHVIDAPDVAKAIEFDAEDRAERRVYRVPGCAKATHLRLVRA